MARLNYQKIAAEGFKTILNVGEYVKKSGLEESLLHMVYLRVSQINGCPYCIDLHWKDATKAGVEARKLNGVIIWQDMPFFTDREKVALAWAETTTHLDPQETIGALYDQALEQFSEKELVDLTFAIAQMNALNRVAIAFHAVPA